MTMSRRWSILFICLALVACGGSVSVLRAKGKVEGGQAHVAVLNNSGAQVNSFYMAETKAVDKAREAGVEPGSGGDIDLWGEDHLGRDSLREGSTYTIGEVAPGRWDVLVTDPDGREQLIRGLKLEAGRKYVLELGDSSWQLPK